MNLFKFFCPVLLGALVSCAGRSDWRKDALNLIGEGRFSQLDSLLEEAEPGASEQELRAIDSLREVMRRLRIEFCYNEGQILSRIRQRVSDTVSPEQIRRWEKSGRLEMRRIDGRKRYFSRSVGNLILLAPELEGLRRIDSSEIGFRERHAARVIAATDSLGMCTNPVTMTIRYTLVVEPDAVPEGMVFDQWTISEESLLGNPNVAYNAESFTIPANAVENGKTVTVEAQYRDATIESEPSILGTAAIIGVAGAGTAVIVWQGYRIGMELYEKYFQPTPEETAAEQPAPEAPAAAAAS